MIFDAGGGTVDLTTLEVVGDNELEEVVPGTSGLCVGTCIGETSLSDLTILNYF